MSHWDQQIFEELISDNQFIEWVRGEGKANAGYWNDWKNTHPKHISEFNEAVNAVKSLNFRGAVVPKTDIQYLWNKTSERINLSKKNSGYRQFFLQLGRVAAFLTLPLMLVSAWLYYSQDNLEHKYAHLLANKIDQKVTVVAPIGARIVVDLPDGSTAWLNSGSELTYPIVFSADDRHVSLTGEAYFKVQKGEVPFLVSSLGPEIKVYGTEFNVNSYPDEDNVTVALVEGKISLVLKGQEKFLVPGQISTFDKGGKSVSVEAGDVNLYCSWRDGKYIFRDKPLSYILRILQRQHNVDISLMNPELGNYRYNATINNESLEQVLQLLSLSAPIKYRYTQRVSHPNGTSSPDHVEISADKTRIIKN